MLNKRKINFTKLIEQISFSFDLMAFSKEPSYHALRVGFISTLIANELGLDRTERIDLYLASLLHDIGAIGIENMLLLEDQRETINLQSHAQLGYEILIKYRVVRGLLRL